MAEKEYIEREVLLRKNCPMRHENGNCLPCGGFCTAVIYPICEAMHNAYFMGEYSTNRHAAKADSTISKTGLMCTACHSDVDKDAVWCKYCGAKMDGKDNE